MAGRALGRRARRDRVAGARAHGLARRDRRSGPAADRGRGHALPGAGGLASRPGPRRRGSRGRAGARSRGDSALAVFAGFTFVLAAWANRAFLEARPIALVESVALSVFIVIAALVAVEVAARLAGRASRSAALVEWSSGRVGLIVLAALLILATLVLPVVAQRAAPDGDSARPATAACWFLLLLIVMRAARPRLTRRMRTAARAIAVVSALAAVTVPLALAGPMPAATRSGRAETSAAPSPCACSPPSIATATASPRPPSAAPTATTATPRVGPMAPELSDNGRDENCNGRDAAAPRWPTAWTAAARHPGRAAPQRPAHHHRLGARRPPRRLGLPPPHLARARRAGRPLDPLRLGVHHRAVNPLGAPSTCRIGRYRRRGAGSKREHRESGQGGPRCGQSSPPPATTRHGSCAARLLRQADRPARRARRDRRQRQPPTRPREKRTLQRRLVAARVVAFLSSAAERPGPSSSGPTSSIRTTRTTTCPARPTSDPTALDRYDSEIAFVDPAGRHPGRSRRDRAGRSAPSSRSPPITATSSRSTATTTTARTSTTRCCGSRSSSTFPGAPPRVVHTPVSLADLGADPGRPGRHHRSRRAERPLAGGARCAAPAIPGAPGAGRAHPRRRRRAQPRRAHRRLRQARLGPPGQHRRALLAVRRPGRARDRAPVRARGARAHAPALWRREWTPTWPASPAARSDSNAVGALPATRSIAATGSAPPAARARSWCGAGT